MQGQSTCTRGWLSSWSTPPCCSTGPQTISDDVRDSCEGNLNYLLLSLSKWVGSLQTSTIRAIRKLSLQAHFIKINNIQAHLGKIYGVLSRIRKWWTNRVYSCLPIPYLHIWAWLAFFGKILCGVKQTRLILNGFCLMNKVLHSWICLTNFFHMIKWLYQDVPEMFSTFSLNILLIVPKLNEQNLDQLNCAWMKQTILRSIKLCLTWS